MEVYGDVRPQRKQQAEHGALRVGRGVEQQPQPQPMDVWPWGDG